MKVRKVENPPLRTAGPILVNVASILWALRKEFMRFQICTDLVILISWGSEEPVGNMDREVNTKAHSNDQGVAGDDIQGEAPEVHKSCNLNDGNTNTQDDHDRASEAAKEDENSDEYCNQ